MGPAPGSSSQAESHPGARMGFDCVRVSWANGPAESLTTPGMGPAGSQSVRSPAAGVVTPFVTHPVNGNA